MCHIVLVLLRLVYVSYRVGVVEAGVCVISCWCCWGWCMCHIVLVLLRLVYVSYRVGVVEADGCVTSCWCC